VGNCLRRQAVDCPEQGISIHAVGDQRLGAERAKLIAFTAGAAGTNHLVTACNEARTNGTPSVPVAPASRTFMSAPSFVPLPAWSRSLYMVASGFGRGLCQNGEDECPEPEDLQDRAPRTYIPIGRATPQSSPATTRESS
jgi:hypothetical protein